MIAKVRTRKKIKPRDILAFATAQQKKEIQAIASRLAGKRVVHVSATPKGGGVAEILQSLIPYSNGLGVESDWYAVKSEAGEKFFLICDKMRNGLQGQTIHITPAEWSHYATINKKIAEKLQKIPYDVLVVHDWQVAYAGFYLERDTRKIFVSHADTSSAYQPVLDGILQAMAGYQLDVFSNKAFVDHRLPRNKVKIISPAIDPLTPKQTIVEQKKARNYLVPYGIPREGQLILQVSRFGPWKNPTGVIEAFRLIQNKYPAAHLAMLGIEEAQDNPDSEKIFAQVKKIAGKTPNIHLFFKPKGLIPGRSKNITDIATFTMMAQNAADIILQNSIKEGFGLTVAEAMWKAKPVIGGPASGIRRQITNKKNGYIVENPSELAERISYLLEDEDARKRIGGAGKKSVTKNFLMHKLLLDYMKVWLEVVS